MKTISTSGFCVSLVWQSRICVLCLSIGFFFSSSLNWFWGLEPTSPVKSLVNLQCPTLMMMKIMLTLLMHPYGVFTVVQHTWLTFSLVMQAKWNSPFRCTLSLYSFSSSSWKSCRLCFTMNPSLYNLVSYVTSKTVLWERRRKELWYSWGTDWGFDQNKWGKGLELHPGPFKATYRDFWQSDR